MFGPSINHLIDRMSLEQVLFTLVLSISQSFVLFTLVLSISQSFVLFTLVLSISQSFVLFILVLSISQSFVQGGFKNISSEYYRKKSNSCFENKHNI